MSNQPSRVSHKLKIGLVLDDTLDKPDGVQQYVLTLGKWLSGQGNEVHYMVGESKRNDIPNLHSLSRNIAVRFNRNRMSIPFKADTKRIRQLLLTVKFDILHIQMPHSPLLAGKIVDAATADTAIMGTFHIIPYSGVQHQASRMLHLWLRKNMRRFDSFISVSPAAQEFAQEAFKINSAVLPNVIDPSVFKTKPDVKSDRDGTTVTIVFLGRLVPRKGCLYLLKAIRQLCKSADLSHKIKVKVGGTGPQLRTLQAYCERAALPQVEFCGFIPEAEKAGYLAQADIAVFPSTGGESFGIVLLEAMATGGGVVIGGDNAGYRTVLSEWPECLIDPKDVVAFAARLERFINDSGLRRNIRQAQAQAVNRYDVANIGPQLVDIYESAIAKRRRAKA